MSESASDLLWALLSLDTADIVRRLSEMPVRELREVTVEYLEMRADIASELQRDARSRGASEDVLEDLAEHLLRQGPKVTAEVLAGGGELPARNLWQHLERGSLLGAFNTACKARLGQSAFDLIAD